MAPARIAIVPGIVTRQSDEGLSDGSNSIVPRAPKILVVILLARVRFLPKPSRLRRASAAPTLNPSPSGVLKRS